jgi:hypothetical protein
MIVVINTWDLYVIAHFPRRHLAQYICSFRKDFLSAKSLAHTRLLPVLPDNGRSVFLLNDQQDADVNVILQKINEEKGSGYIFSDDLQRTYIIELIHFITKLYYQTFPSQHLSAN